MLPEVRPRVSTALPDQLEHQLGLPPHLEAGQLDVEGVDGIAVVAAAHCNDYAATGHLLGLLAALPAPTKAGEHFWSDLWRPSGTAYLLPVNIKARCCVRWQERQPPWPGRSSRPSMRRPRPSASRPGR
jgi:hypothetical protein